MRWVFKIEHMAGVQNFGPDALSRYLGQSPGSGSLNKEDKSWSDDVEIAVFANVRCRSDIRVLMWDVLQRTGISDPGYSGLLHVVGSGVKDWPEELAEYQRFRDDLLVLNGVVMFKGKVVVPGILWQDVLDALHRAQPKGKVTKFYMT